MKLWDSNPIPRGDDMNPIEIESAKDRKKRLLNAFEIAQKANTVDGRLLAHQIGFTYVNPRGTTPSIEADQHPLYDAIKSGEKGKISTEALQLLKRNKKLEKKLTTFRQS